MQARYFVSGQAAISGDRYNVDWFSLILGNDKKKKTKRNFEQASRREQRKESKETKRAKAIASRRNSSKKKMPTK